MSCFIIINIITIIAILVTTILFLLLLVIFRHDLRGISERQHKSSARCRRTGQLIKRQSDGRSWDKAGTISESWTTSDNAGRWKDLGHVPDLSPAGGRTLLPTRVFKHCHCSVTVPLTYAGEEIFWTKKLPCHRWWSDLVTFYYLQMVQRKEKELR